MFKIRSITVRLVLAISLTSPSPAHSRNLWIVQQRALTHLALDEQLKLQYDSVIAAIDYEGRAALAVDSVVAALPPVADAIAREDRDGLAALLGDAMKPLTRRHPADHVSKAAGEGSLSGPRAKSLR